MAYKRSVLKWAGSKYLVLKHLLPHFPNGKRLIEPFMGGGSVFLNTTYPHYVLGEKNPDLFNFFSLLKKDGPQFIDQCKTYFSPSHNQKEKYYELRTLFNETTDTTLKSCLFLYLNRHGYNGLCRFNRNSEFNVPFGRIEKPYFPLKEMLYFHEKSQTAHLILGHFLESFSMGEQGDVIYCDPPYLPLSKSSNFSQYTAEGFKAHDHEILAQSARDAANLGMTVIISNHDTEMSRVLYSGADLFSFEAQRMISTNSKNRMAAKELIAIFSGT